MIYPALQRVAFHESYGKYEPYMCAKIMYKYKMFIIIIRKAGWFIFTRFWCIPVQSQHANNQQLGTLLQIINHAQNKE